MTVKKYLFKIEVDADIESPTFENIENTRAIIYEFLEVTLHHMNITSAYSVKVQPDSEGKY